MATIDTSKKPSALEKLQARLKAATESENQIDPLAPPSHNAPSPEPPSDSIKDGIGKLDFIGNTVLVTEEGSLDTKALNNLLQKVAFSAHQQAVETTEARIKEAAASTDTAIQSHLQDYSKSQALQGSEFSKDAATQSHALLYRNQQEALYPDATAAELNAITSEYVASLAPAAAPATPEVVAQAQETDWAEELNLDLTPPEAPPATTDQPNQPE